MSKPLPSSAIVCIETEAFYTLCEYVVDRLKADLQKKDKWLSEQDAMKRLGITSKATLQKLRKEYKIHYTQPLKKNIQYDAESIENYLDKHSTKWVSEKHAMTMLGIKSKADIQKLADSGKIKSKEIDPNVFVYSISSIQSYIEKNR